MSNISLEDMKLKKCARTHTQMPLNLSKGSQCHVWSTNVLSLYVMMFFLLWEKRNNVVPWIFLFAFFQIRKTCSLLNSAGNAPPFPWKMKFYLIKK